MSTYAAFSWTVCSGVRICRSAMLFLGLRCLLMPGLRNSRRLKRRRLFGAHRLLFRFMFRCHCTGLLRHRIAQRLLPCRSVKRGRGRIKQLTQTYQCQFDQKLLVRCGAVLHVAFVQKFHGRVIPRQRQLRCLFRHTCRYVVGSLQQLPVLSYLAFIVACYYKFHYFTSALIVIRKLSLLTIYSSFHLTSPALSISMNSSRLHSS